MRAPPAPGGNTGCRAQNRSAAREPGPANGADWRRTSAIPIASGRQAAGRGAAGPPLGAPRWRPAAPVCECSPWRPTGARTSTTTDSAGIPLHRTSSTPGTFQPPPTSDATKLRPMKPLAPVTTARPLTAARCSRAPLRPRAPGSSSPPSGRPSRDSDAARKDATDPRAAGPRR